MGDKAQANGPGRVAFELPASPAEQGGTPLRAGTLSLGRAFGLGFASLGMGAGLIGAPVGLMVAGREVWIVYVLSMVIIAALVVAVARFARRYVVTGSLMSYLGEGFGPVPRTIAGAALVFAYMMFCASAVLYPVAFAQGLLLDVHKTWLSGIGGQILFMWSIALALGYVSHRGPSVSARLAIVLTLLSLPLVLLLFTAVAVKSGLSIPVRGISERGGKLTGVIAATVIFAGTYVGFEGFTALAAETADPIRNIPRILVGLLATLSGGYFFATLIAIPVYLRHATELAAGQSPSAILAGAAGLQWLKIPLDLALVLNLLAGLVPMLNDGSRVIATAATAGILPRALGQIHPRSRVPVRALWLLVFVSCAVPMAAEVFAHGAPLQIVFALLPAVFFLWMIPYMGMCLGLIVLSKRDGRLLSLEPLLGAAGFLLIAFLFCYQISHPGGKVELLSSGVTLGAFATVCVMTLTRLRRGRRAGSGAHLRQPSTKGA